MLSAEPGHGARRWVLPLVGLAFTVPFVVAALVLQGPRWFPVADLALIEARLRDVPSADIPLVGLVGRIGGTGESRGSHPGPIAFYSMWPVYALLGRSAWALQVSSLAVHLAAIGTALWLALRRGGVPLVLGLATALAVLSRAYGMDLLTEPWNPFLPVLWFVAFVMAVWSVVDGDEGLFVVTVLTGSLCLQTHLPYGAVVAAGTLLAVAAICLRLLTRSSPMERRRRLLALAVGLAGGALVWLPPLLEQLRPGEGNLTTILDYFRNPPEAALGPSEGLRLFVRSLDPRRLVWGDVPLVGFPLPWSVVPGALHLVVWAGAVGVAVRLRVSPLLRLQLVVGVLLVAAALAVTRIFGEPWNYLTLWVWGLNAMMLLTIGWTVVEASRRGPPVLQRPTRWAPALAAVGGAVALSALTADAASVERPDAASSDLVAALAPRVAEGLDERGAPGGGRRGTYRLTVVDPVHGDFLAFGLLNELERRGFHLGMSRQHSEEVTPHRVVEPVEATGELHLAVGSDVDRWRARKTAVELVHHDPRSRSEREEFERLHDQLAAELRASGDGDLVERLEDVGGLRGGSRLEPLQRLVLSRMRELGLPVAVFADGRGTQ